MLIVILKLAMVCSYIQINLLSVASYSSIFKLSKVKITIFPIIFHNTIQLICMKFTLTRNTIIKSSDTNTLSETIRIHISSISKMLLKNIGNFDTFFVLQALWDSQKLRLNQILSVRSVCNLQLSPWV